MNKAIIVDHLFKEGQLNDVSFIIQKGEFVGIIGTETSGKNSILKIISGLQEPTSGFVSVLGHDPFLKTPDFLKQLSYITNRKNHLLKKLPAIDVLDITRKVYGLSDREFNKNLNELAQFINDPSIIDSLIYKPDIVLLDDSHLELDSIYEYNKKYESTTLFATEKIDDLINLVRRVIIIDKEEILFDGAIDEVITKFVPEKLIKARLSSEINPKSVGEIGTLKKYEYPNIIISAFRSVVSLAAAEFMQNFPIVSLSIEELSIEEIIDNIKGNNLYI